MGFVVVWKIKAHLRLEAVLRAPQGSDEKQEPCCDRDNVGKSSHMHFQKVTKEMKSAGGSGEPITCVSPCFKSEHIDAETCHTSWSNFILVENTLSRRNRKFP